MMPDAVTGTMGHRWSEGSPVEAADEVGRPLKGRRALVTGASRGIGQAIALGLAGAGADVVVNYHSSDESAEQLTRRIDGMGVGTWFYPADVSDIAQVRAMRSLLARHFGSIDILVNNAGINIDRLFKKMDPDSWERVLSVNLGGVYNCTNAFLEDLMASSHGRIINITSIVGQMGNVGQVNYAASKAGVIGMTKALARELARNNVTVNAIAPGFIDTDMVRGIPEPVKEKVLAQIPMRRFGLPEEVAHAAVFLASDDAAYLTGHVLNVNGGMYL
jgi:3-oxoacyl-[acyl-carrier protein] reductase